MSGSSLTPSERATATGLVIKRFEHKPLRWDETGVHCINLARTQAAAMGHKVPPVPRIRSALGAKKALKKRGAGNVIELVDQFLPRHPAPAYARLGDLVALPGHDIFNAIAVADGFGNLWGWHADTEMRKLEVVKQAQADVLVAWKL